MARLPEHRLDVLEGKHPDCLTVEHGWAVEGLIISELSSTGLLIPLSGSGMSTLIYAWVYCNAG